MKLSKIELAKVLLATTSMSARDVALNLCVWVPRCAHPDGSRPRRSPSVRCHLLSATTPSCGDACK
jgi:hypothetical protein